MAGLLVVGLLAAGCANDTYDDDGGDAPPGGGEVSVGEVVTVGSDIEREDPTGLDVSPVVDGDTAFALDLYRELVSDDPDANLFLSPYSISLALSMGLPGARGQTWDEMAEVLRADEGEDWHRARNALDRGLVRDPPTIDELAPLQLEITNSLWGQSGYPFLDDYLDHLARHYGAEMNTVDFVAAAEEARAAINRWTADATNDRIEELIPEGAVDELTRLVLVNAIWFHANWVHQFDPEQTANDTFTTVDGTEVTVSMMRQSLTTAYGEGDGWSTVRLRYAGEASMLVIAPDEGRFDEVAGALDSDLLERVRTSISGHLVDLAMPRFEFRSQFSLPEVLERLGMVEALIPPGPDGGADLTRIIEARELYVTDVLHEAFVSVDEEGTEAAAATAMIAGVTSAPPPATLTLDRPFIFLIEDDATDAILFIGQVTDPTAG